MKIGGIYEIVNTANGRRYIGSAVLMEQRQRQHFNALARGKHHNAKLQAAWNKYGAEAFEFHVLMACFDPQELVPWEQRYMDEIHPEHNLSPTAGSPLGMKHSAASRANMSASQKGQTPEVLAKMAAVLRGRPMSAEQRAKIKAAHLARRPADWVPKVSRPRATLKGYRLSAEHKAKISASNKGKHGGPQSPAAAAQLGKPRPPHTPEMRAYLSSLKIGKPWTPSRRAAQEHRTCV